MMHVILHMIHKIEKKNSAEYVFDFSAQYALKVKPNRKQTQVKP